MGARWAVLGWLLLVGCRGVSLRPEAFNEAARVEAMELGFQPDGSGLLSLRLSVRNPTSDPATLTRVDFELAVDGQRVAVGLQQMEVPLAGDGPEHTVEVRFPLVSGEVLGTATTLPRQVRLSGGALLRYGASTERRAPFQEQRVMRLPWVPIVDPPRE